MTPKEKANELIRKFTLTFSSNIEEAKQSALISINEIIDAYYYLEVEILHTQFGELLNKINGEIRIKYIEFCMYWIEVKKEIEQL